MAVQTILGRRWADNALTEPKTSQYEQDGCGLLVQESIQRLLDWKNVKDGYSSLAQYLLFFILFLTTVALQLDPSTAFGIHSAIQKSVIKDISSVNSQAAFWEYLVGAEGSEKNSLLGRLFADSWYNGACLWLTFEPQ